MTENTKMPKIIPDNEDYARYHDFSFGTYPDDDEERIMSDINWTLSLANDVLQYFSSWNHTHLQDEELANALNIVQKKLPATLEDWQAWAATIYHEGRE